MFSKEETTPCNFSHTEPKRAADSGNSIDETHLEIARESERIRREMEKERRSKSMSPTRDKPPPPRDRSPTRTFLTLTTMPKVLFSLSSLFKGKGYTSGGSNSAILTLSLCLMKVNS